LEVIEIQAANEEAELSESKEKDASYAEAKSDAS